MGTTLGTIIYDIELKKSNFSDFINIFIIISYANFDLWVTQMVPKIISSKSMNLQLSKDVLENILRLIERFLQHTEVTRKFDKFSFHEEITVLLEFYIIIPIYVGIIVVNNNVIIEQCKFILGTIEVTLWVPLK